jgi:hypothetical protein
LKTENKVKRGPVLQLNKDRTFSQQREAKYLKIDNNKIDYGKYPYRWLLALSQLFHYLNYFLWGYVFLESNINMTKSVLEVQAHQ